MLLGLWAQFSEASMMKKTTKKQYKEATKELCSYVQPIIDAEVYIIERYVSQLEDKIKDLQHEVNQKTSALLSIENGASDGVSNKDMVNLLRGEARAVLTAFADKCWRKA